jgi:type II secretory pathway pseudopilin PulG
MKHGSISGFGLLEVTLALGMLGILSVGTLGLIELTGRSTRTSNLTSAANSIQHTVRSVLSQESTCHLSLKRRGSIETLAPAQFNLSQEIGQAEQNFQDRLSTIVVPNESSGGTPIVVAQVGSASQGSTLIAMSLIRLGAPLQTNNGEFTTAYELKLSLSNGGSNPFRGFGSAEVTRSVFLSVVTGSDSGVQSIVRCSSAGSSTEQICSVTGGSLVDGTCIYQSIVTAENAATRSTLRAQLQSGDTRAAGLPVRGIATDGNLFAQGTVNARALRSQVGIQTTDGDLIQGAWNTSTNPEEPGIYKVNMRSTLMSNSLKDIRGFRGSVFAWDTDIGYVGMLDPSGTPSSSNNNKDLLIAYGDDEEDRVRIGYKAVNQPLFTLAHFTRSSGGDLEQTAGVFNLGGMMRFGTQNPLTSGPMPRVTEGGYLAVAGDDLELGSNDARLTHLAFYNRALANHLDIRARGIRATGGADGVPGGFYLQHNEWTTAPAVSITQNTSDPTRVGGGIIEVRRAGSVVGPFASPNTAGPIAFRIDAEAMGSPGSGKLLASPNDSSGGSAMWKTLGEVVSPTFFTFRTSDSTAFESYRRGNPMSGPIYHRLIGGSRSLGIGLGFCSITGHPGEGTIRVYKSSVTEWAVSIEVPGSPDIEFQIGCI